MLVDVLKVTTFRINSISTIVPVRMISHQNDWFFGLLVVLYVYCWFFWFFVALANKTKTKNNVKNESSPLKTNIISYAIIKVELVFWMH